MDEIEYNQLMIKMKDQQIEELMNQNQKMIKMNMDLNMQLHLEKVKSKFLVESIPRPIESIPRPIESIPRPIESIPRKTGKRIKHNLFLQEQFKIFPGRKKEFKPRNYSDLYKRIRNKLKVVGDKFLMIKKGKDYVKYNARDTV